jgi:hypothetical protein
MVPKDDTHVNANPTLAGDGSDDTPNSAQGDGGPPKRSFLHRDR